LIKLPLLQVKNISRSFGEFQAIQPLDFEIPGGKIVILSGPNGAGKTTLLNCISGLLRPSSGHVLVEGFDLYKEEVAAKQRLACVPDVPHFYQELTTWEHLQFISLAFRNEQDWEKQAEFYLRAFGLWESRNMYPHNLSRGMRLKLGITMALIRPFKVLLMDEPTSALDQQSTHTLIDKLIDLGDKGCAILLTSHDVTLADTLDGTMWRIENGSLETG
jgi:ABC-2 type transport system ATP-binding protein